jgi:hypothetical protein
MDGGGFEEEIRLVSEIAAGPRLELYPNSLEIVANSPGALSGFFFDLARLAVERTN